MKQNTKILLITLGIFLLLVILVAGGLFAGKLFLENRVDRAFESHIAQAKLNTMAHLQEKYPEKSFEIINVKCETPDEGIPVTRIPTWESEVWFEIKDNEGGIYVARTDTTKFGDEGILCTQDNVQTNEISAAAKSHLQNILGLDAEYFEKYSRIGAMYYLYHEKYTGDIIEFATRAVEKNIYFEAYCFNKKIDMNKAMSENLTFFKLFNNILIAETKKDIAVSELKHHVFQIANPELVIPELAYDITAIYTFDESHNILKKESKLLDTGDYLYTKPYSNFDEQVFEKIDSFYVNVGDWMPKIGELETQTGRVYSNITPITTLHVALEGFAYYVPYDLSQIDSNKTLLLLTFIDSFQAPEYIAQEIGFGDTPKYITENHIYIAPMGNGIQWMIAVADLGNAPVRITE